VLDVGTPFDQLPLALQCPVLSPTQHVPLDGQGASGPGCGVKRAAAQEGAKTGY